MEEQPIRRNKSGNLESIDPIQEGVIRKLKSRQSEANDRDGDPPIQRKYTIRKTKSGRQQVENERRDEDSGSRRFISRTPSHKEMIKVRLVSLRRSRAGNRKTPTSVEGRTFEEGFRGSTTSILNLRESTSTMAEASDTPNFSRLRRFPYNNGASEVPEEQDSTLFRGSTICSDVEDPRKSETVQTMSSGKTFPTNRESTISFLSMHTKKLEHEAKENRISRFSQSRRKGKRVTNHSLALPHPRQNKKIISSGTDKKIASEI